ncbi:MAG: hypothetical protein HPY50_08825 [Firmicutes bacterium]|nr:hypothetical protein [Bacillota bacterium]
MKDSEIDQLNEFLRKNGRKVCFTENSFRDFKSFQKNQRRDILALIIKPAVEKNPLLKPDGHGEPLQSPLTGFAKIKPKQMGIRIVYRPKKLENGVIRLEVIAIGPRDKDEVYRIAAERISSFKAELDK